MKKILCLLLIILFILPINVLGLSDNYHDRVATITNTKIDDKYQKMDKEFLHLLQLYRMM